MENRRSNLTLGLMVLSLALGIVVAGCEKEVKINPQSGKPQIVVDGFIETGLPPVVTLTKSFSYFSRVDFSTLDDAFIKGATVKVSDGSREITLREYALDSGGSVANYIIYTIDTADLSALTFIGQPNTFYRLTIDYDGKQYTSLTKIPEVKGPDSLWFQIPTPLPDSSPDIRQVFLRYSDPDTFGNRIRYFTSRNGGPFLAPNNSVNDDAIVNGTSFDINLIPGTRRSAEPSFDSLLYFFRNDSVVLKWCAIDKGVYDFWSTLEFSLVATGNPFASPVAVTSNITGGALGVWAGYGTTYKSIKITE